ncbi:hypothetical protein EYF80_017248 [Liparis tanakae]|uniref:Uncharacterized protein n=1 Tax=Liparis tanakae TaxID=230148 RepID=A0A4Z2I5C3_9TELE|nr:hypothetical protein EYF80_017248 [Liparis tanakae]
MKNSRPTSDGHVVPCTSWGLVHAQIHKGGEGGLARRFNQTSGLILVEQKEGLGTRDGGSIRLQRNQVSHLELQRPGGAAHREGGAAKWKEESAGQSEMQAERHQVGMLLLQLPLQSLRLTLFLQLLALSSTLLLLLLDAFLPVVQQLPLVLLGVPALSGQLRLLPLVSLRALLVLLLQALEVPAQRGLTGHVEDRTEDQDGTTNEGED